MLIQGNVTLIPIRERYQIRRQVSTPTRGSVNHYDCHCCSIQSTNRSAKSKKPKFTMCEAWFELQEGF